MVNCQLSQRNRHFALIHAFLFGSFSLNLRHDSLHRLMVFANGEARVGRWVFTFDNGFAFGVTLLIVTGILVLVPVNGVISDGCPVGLFILAIELQLWMPSGT